MEVDFVGYAADCRVEGKLDLEDARLADLLNRESSIHLRRVLVVGRADSGRHRFDDLIVNRDELGVVVANGPRGDPRRRLSTTSDCVAISLGPYHAEGFIHFPTMVRGDAELADTRPMIALTDAVLEYDAGVSRMSRWFRTLLVNRALAGSVRIVSSVPFRQTAPA